MDGNPDANGDPSGREVTEGSTQASCAIVIERIDGDGAAPAPAITAPVAAAADADADCSTPAPATGVEPMPAVAENGEITHAPSPPLHTRPPPSRADASLARA